MNSYFQPKNSFLKSIFFLRNLVYHKIVFLFLLSFYSAQAQIGEILWEDNFNSFTTEHWNKDIGDGCPNLCGWGNQELQSYQEDNVFIEDIPGEEGNKALVLEAKRQNAGNRAFTSGKVTTKDKVAIKYGMIEARVRVPDLKQGLWPAVWFLGTANLNWPAIGEIDMMEMGFSDEGRAFQQEPESTVNTYVGANTFFPLPDGGVGNIAYDVNYNKPYVATTPLNDRFVKYRVYWEPTQIRFTVIDNGEEYDLYENPFPIDANNSTTAPFTKPFYMLLNLAVGGTLPGTLNNNQVTAPLPGKMYVDYVRVYQWNGHGEVTLSDGTTPPEQGGFGVYTDETPVNNQLTFGTDAEFYVFGETLTASDEAPYEGENVLAFTNDPSKGWFGAGITSLFGKNMSNYVENGFLKFKIKIPADVSFIIGLNDNYTNAADISFPAGENKYGLIRNGEWGQISIPIKDFSGLLAFQDMSYVFRIGNDGAIPSTPFEFAIDDIIWDDGNTNTCEPSVISTSYTINDGNPSSGTSITVVEGDNLKYRVDAETEGNWSWTGPNGFTSNQSEITFNNIQLEQAGSYTASYTNNCGAISSVTYTLVIEENLEGCILTAANGDFIAEIMEDGTGTYLTFIPQKTGIGDSLVILYYSTNNNTVFPGYFVEAGVPYKINSRSGQRIYFYYTYSLSAGGENNSMNNKMDFIAGDCIITKKGTKRPKSISFYPNPFNQELLINAAYQVNQVKLFDTQGKMVLQKTRQKDVSTLKMDTHKLAAGIYILKIELNSGKEQMLKVVKQ
ncbi:T9SS type A sorting domain-containing protein [Aquimarina brevivitae]|uniref:Putative secreted protein (Por secretion system target) n=1 Tax=Aquimarina brevivitae TaxID=323412 RepID=A0A4Q7PG51_9FLAO|nr:T9SS type A sorting domain-containing protein [Aquimarina brevivitae]RZS99471.1 putative secreted protein (Por secretion system target) [Aquimarina brevivitae]